MSLGKHLEGCTVDEKGNTLIDYCHNEDSSRLDWDLAYSLFFTILDNGGIPMYRSKDQIPDKVTCWYNKYLTYDIATKRAKLAPTCTFYIKYEKQLYNVGYVGGKHQMHMYLYHDGYPYRGTECNKIVNALIHQLPIELVPYL